MATGGLLERASQLAALQQAVDEGSVGQGSVVLVTGEAGIGKTSLVRAFLAELTDRSGAVRVLTGACDDLLAPRDMGPLRDAAFGTGGPLERALAGDAAAEDVFGAMIEELAGPPLTVLVVEDMHWADDATIDIVRYAARRVRDLAAVLVLTFRDDAVCLTHPLQELLGTLSGVPRRRIALAPLSAAAVGELAAGTGRDAAALYAVTGGNPFYVTEALAVPPGDVPATVADAVLARVRRLDERCRRALEQLSVVPNQAGFDLVEALLGGGLETLAGAEERGIIEVRADGLAFRHELARRAIEQSLPALRRRVFHREVLDVLRAASDPELSRLVHHAVAAQDVASVVRYAPAAGRAAARAGSHRQALAHFEAALRYADRFAPPGRAGIVDDYAWELYNAHRFTEAVRAGRAAVALRERLDDPVALGESLVRLSRHIYMTGRTDEAVAAAERAVHVIEPAGSPGAMAYATTCRGALLALADRPAEAVPVLHRARRAAEAAGRGDLVALCLNYLGGSGAELYGEAQLRHLRESIAVARAGGHHESAARGYTNLGELLYRYGRHDELAECVADGLAFTRERGFWSHAYNLEVHRCLLLQRRGDWAAAEHGLEALLDGHDDPGMLYVYSVPPYARLLARKGDRRAGPLLAEAWARATRQRSLLGVAYAGLALVEWHWLCGDPVGAVPVRDVLLRRTERPGAAPIRAELMRYLARAGLGGTVFAGCPKPYAAGLRGDWRAAADAWRSIGDPYERALELAESGEVAPTLEALHMLERLGADAAATLVRRRLRELGLARRPRGAAVTTRANPAGLTTRQVDVLALLAEGMTNAEIADRLVLSVRTVDHHVSAILGKLGVPTRRAAAASARSLDLVASAR
ncbi:MAG TPA: AAA family ATPase [Streptosporangiaceae bacterium]